MRTGRTARQRPMIQTSFDSKGKHNHVEQQQYENSPPKGQICLASADIILNIDKSFSEWNVAVLRSLR